MKLLLKLSLALGLIIPASNASIPTPANHEQTADSGQLRLKPVFYEEAIDLSKLPQHSSYEDLLVDVKNLIKDILQLENPLMNICKKHSSTDNLKSLFTEEIFTNARDAVQESLQNEIEDIRSSTDLTSEIKEDRIKNRQESIDALNKVSYDSVLSAIAFSYNNVQISVQNLRQWIANFSDQIANYTKNNVKYHKDTFHGRYQCLYFLFKEIEHVNRILTGNSEIEGRLLLLGSNNRDPKRCIDTIEGSISESVISVMCSLLGITAVESYTYVPKGQEPIINLRGNFHKIYDKKNFVLN